MSPIMLKENEHFVFWKYVPLISLRHRELAQDIQQRAVIVLSVLQVEPYKAEVHNVKLIVQT